MPNIRTTSVRRGDIEGLRALAVGLVITLEGAVALGWLISHAVANVADNKCPFTDTYPCTIPTAMDPGHDLMKIFDVTFTKTKCYEDGLNRERVCTTVSR